MMPMPDIRDDCALCTTGEGHVHITSASREQRVRDLIAHWQPRLGLQAWDIRYQDIKIPAKAHNAYVARRDQERCAQVYVNPKLPDSVLEECVLHELLHIALSPAFDLAMRAAANQVLIDELDQRHENAIDLLVFALIGKRTVMGKALKWMPAFTEAA